MAEHPFPRTLVGFLAVTIIVVVLAGVLFLDEEQKSLRATAEGDLSVVAHLKVGEIVQWRDDRVADADVLAMSPPFVALVSAWLAKPGDSEGAVILATLQSMTLHMTYDAALLFDSSGSLRLSAGAVAQPVPPEVTQRVQQSLQQRRTLLIDLYMSSEGQSRLGVVAPIFDVEGSDSPAATLVLLTDPDLFLYPLVLSWPTSSASAETLLVRRDGDSVLFLSELRHADQSPLTLRYPLTDTELPAVMAVNGVEGIIEGKDYRGVDVLADLLPIPGSSWFMVAKIDRDEVSTPRSTSTMVIVLMLAMLAIAVMLAAFLWQRQQKAYYFGLLAAQDRATESEQHFRVLVESSPDAIFVQTNGWFAYVNPAAVQLFGATDAAELIGTPVLDRLPAEFQDKARERMLQLNRTKQSVPPLEEVYLKMDGTPVPIEVSGVPIHYAGEDGALEYVRDITERIRAMDALQKSEEALRSLNMVLEQKVIERTAQFEASNKELEAFAYSVSHDLRAPLRAIEGFSRILLEDYAGVLDAEGKRLLSVVRSSAARMDRLITDLLQLSRVSQSELHPVVLDMNELVQNVREELLASGIGEQTEFVQGDLPEAAGDPTLSEACLLQPVVKRVQVQCAFRGAPSGGGGLYWRRIRDVLCP